MAIINLTLQGKGGVGKSYVASLLAQYYAARGDALLCFDTDPVNKTFAGYGAFGVQTVRLGDRPDELDPRRFDQLVTALMAAEGGAVVIDNGASTFLPLLGYLVEAEVLGMLKSAGHEVRVHTVLTGGQALPDTLAGLAQILNLLDVPVVVWLNEYFGQVARPNSQGEVEGFEHSPLYRKYRSRIHALVRLPQVRRETFGADVEQMMRARLTFAEAAEHPDFSLMARQRLRMTWRAIHAALDQAVL